MKLLITGGSGFLGHRAAAHFSSLGYSILTPGHSELDITDKAGVKLWFQQNCPDAVIHCAAISDTSLCQREPEQSSLINVAGSIHVAEACKEHGARFLFCSSDQVYHSSSLPGPHSEKEFLIPGTVYGRQKLLAEQECLDICPNTVILRLSWMYSSGTIPGQHGHLLTTLRAALKDPSLPLSWSPRDYRGITDADSVVKNLPAALTLPAGIYNFGSENDMDMYHTIRSVFEQLNLADAVTRLTPNLQTSPRDIRMDSALVSSFGITFDSTREGLYRALLNCI